MNLQGKALYNLLRISTQDSQGVKAHPWQVEDYRLWKSEKIFRELAKLEIPLNEKAFFEYAADCETPEELVDCLWVKEEEGEAYDRAYLLLFELWRRLLPEKQALSIFCDELDRCIEQYDKGELKDEEQLQKCLSMLEDVLDDSVDEGEAEKAVFPAVAAYCAHDLEGFLYDYIADKIDEGDETYASELLDGFYPYIQDRKWFDFLRARLYSLTDEEEGGMMVERILEQLQEEPDLPLLLEMSSALIGHEDGSLFKQAVGQAVPLIETEGQLQDLLTLLADHPAQEKQMKQFLGKRASLDQKKPIDRSDKAFAFLKNSFGNES